MLHVKCQMSHAICHTSDVTGYMSHVTSQTSHDTSLLRRERILSFSCMLHLGYSSTFRWINYVVEFAISYRILEMQDPE